MWNAAQNQENLTLTCHGLALGVNYILVHWCTNGLD
jgi:hypothetical protein